jgi:uncharacterized spore protein YtfJ
MNVNKLLREAHDAITVQRVYGKPYERDGVVVIPAAVVQGGGGGGGGEGPDAGGGGGFGIRARPAGAYVIREGRVEWQPALDVNRIVLGGQLLVALALLTLRPRAVNASRRWFRRRARGGEPARRRPA